MPSAASTSQTIVLHALAVALASAALCGAGPQPATGCQPIVGDRWIHLVSSGESWATIGARVGVDAEVLARRNGRTVRVPLQRGDVLGIDNRHIVPAYDEDGLLVNLPQRMLFHYRQGGIRAYPAAPGPDSPMPLGGFSIVSMDTEPVWDVPRGLDRPLDRYWMGLSLDSMGLPGITAPSTICDFATQGCIRLHPDDIEALFPYVGVGERGRIVNEPILVAFDGTDVFLEVHPDRYGRSPNPLWRAMEMIKQLRLQDLVELSDVVRVVREAEGLAVPVTVRR